MTLPLYQVGDPVRPGMAVAEIPDLKDWEAAANIGELDRGHLAVNDKVAITIIAVPGRQFHGHIKELGGTTGPFWDRHFECKIALDDPVPELRPGMSAQLVVTTDEMRQRSLGALRRRCSRATDERLSTCARDEVSRRKT